jgi:hypothetical protein
MPPLPSEIRKRPVVRNGDIKAEENNNISTGAGAQP